MGGSARGQQLAPAQRGRVRSWQLAVLRRRRTTAPAPTFARSVLFRRGQHRRCARANLGDGVPAGAPPRAPCSSERKRGFDQGSRFRSKFEAFGSRAVVEQLTPLFFLVQVEWHLFPSWVF